MWGIFGGSGSDSKGSAFARVAAHDAAIIEAKGKVLALRAANDATTALLDELEAGAAEIHQVRDAIEARLSQVEARL